MYKYMIKIHIQSKKFLKLISINSKCIYCIEYVWHKTAKPVHC